MQSRSRGWIASAVGSEGRLFAAGGRKCVAGSVVKVKLSVGIRELPRFGRVDPCAPGVRAVFLQDSKMDSTTPTKPSHHQRKFQVQHKNNVAVGHVISVLP